MKKKMTIYLVILVLIIPASIFISRYLSIKHAVQNCTQTNLIPIEPINEIDISFYLLGNLPDNNYGGSRSPYLPVWLVTMTGKWELLGRPALASGELESPPPQFSTCGSVVNFFTTSAFRTFAR